MSRTVTILSAILLSLLTVRSAFAWNASFVQAAKANGNFTVFGIVDNVEAGGLKLDLEVARALTAIQQVSGAHVTFHLSESLKSSECSLEKSAGECLDRDHKQVRAEDALGRIRKGNRVILSGYYEPGKDEFIIEKLVRWVP